MKTIIAIILFLCPIIVMAQVEHNFKMGPKNTDCHTLPSTFESAEQAISAVESSKFRFQQSIRISRIQSPRSVVFYSCDGEQGYLIAQENETLRLIYPDVPMAVWNDFINEENPIEFYNTQIKGIYDVME